MHIAMTVGDMDPRTGGPPQVVAGSAEALARIGHRVTIFTRDSENLDRAIADRLSDLPIKVRGFPIDRPNRLARSAAMKRAFIEDIQSIDVLHVHGVWEGHLAQLAAEARKAGKRVFVSSHGMLDRWSMRQSAWKKQAMLRFGETGKMLEHATALIVGTAEESGEARAVAPHIPHVVIANGVDVEAMKRGILDLDPEPMLKRLPEVRNWHRTILYFSRIHPKKGLVMLVSAFGQLKDAHPDCGLLVVGIADDTDYLALIERTIEQNGLGAQVALTTDFTGATAKMAFALADVFALPSHQEGFSMAIVEAMAAGKPLLITDKCHMNEVASWKAGIVVPDTPSGILDGLGKVLTLDDQELAGMGRNGASVAHEKFEWTRIASQLEDLYSQPYEK